MKPYWEEYIRVVKRVLLITKPINPLSKKHYLIQEKGDEVR